MVLGVNGVPSAHKNTGLALVTNDERNRLVTVAAETVVIPSAATSRHPAPGLPAGADDGTAVLGAGAPVDTAARAVFDQYKISSAAFHIHRGTADHAGGLGEWMLQTLSGIVGGSSYQVVDALDVDGKDGSAGGQVPKVGRHGIVGHRVRLPVVDLWHARQARRVHHLLGET